MAVTGTLTGPGIDRILSLLEMLAAEDAQLRKMRAQVAPMATAFDQTSITGDTQYKIAEAQAQDVYYTSGLVVFDSTSGLGRYMMTGGVVSGTRGLQIPAGNYAIVIPGMPNLRNFVMQAEATQTLSFARMLFL